jgi:undecaprenyl-diphosphatase
MYKGQGPGVRKSEPVHSPSHTTVLFVLTGSLLLIALAVTVPGLSQLLSQLDRQISLAIAAQAAAMPGGVRVAELVLDNPLFKGIVVMAAFWGVWFSAGTSPYQRIQLVAVLALSVVAIIMGRLLALLLPYRTRPRYITELQHLFGDPGYSLQGWSSMPSDHAVLFVSLAVGIAFVNRRVGLFLVAHALLFICLPRIVLGMHFFGDILVGALVGEVVGLLAFPLLVKAVSSMGAARLMERHPGWFHACAIWITMQFALIFTPVRSFVVGVVASL